ncbi:hypothetical protein pb186bvf_021082 [Paramecium bursaria]
MNKVVLIGLISLAYAAQFLEPQIFVEEDHSAFVQIMSQDSPLFTEEQLKQSQETLQATATPPSEEYSEKTLAPAEDSLALLAKNYDQDLPAQGDCIIIYSQCNFKGASAKNCKEPGVLFNFPLPIYSIYIPTGQELTLTDKQEQTQMAFLMSDACLTQPIVMEDSQKDVGIHFDETILFGKGDDGMPGEALQSRPQPGNQFIDAMTGEVTKELGNYYYLNYKDMDAISKKIQDDAEKAKQDMYSDAQANTQEPEIQVSPPVQELENQPESQVSPGAEAQNQEAPALTAQE